MTLLLFYLLTALGVSFLCSLVEAALLSLPSSYVETLSQQGSRVGRLLAAMKRDIDRPLAAILTLNTVAHTFGAAGVGAEATYLFGHEWIGLISVVVTILILFLSEIIPKTLGAVHARRLTAFTAYAVIAMIYATYPLVVVCQWLGRALAGGKRGDLVTRDELLTMARLSGTQGALTTQEYDTVRNLLNLRNVRIKDVMTPRLVLFALSQHLTAEEVVKNHRPLRFARIPVFEKDSDHLTGVVYRSNIYEAYADGKLDLPIQMLATPIQAVPETATVGQILPRFIETQSQIFQVVDEYGGTAGIVTFEDAIETLLGQEIVGETDPAIDMRELARRLASRRLARRVEQEKERQSES